MDYKDTLLMPQANFPMRANLPVKEVDIQKYWASINLYKKSLNLNQRHKTFVLHDGPPYANNPIHIGHAFQKTLKDFVIRYKTLSGFYTPYIPGWDTHGLPIEQQVSKKINRKSVSINEYRLKCHEYSLSQVENQKKDFMRLGILGQWEKPYLTLDKEYESKQIEVFAKMASLGFIYQGLKPVYWSYSSETALAEAEIEYIDIESHSAYISFLISKNQIECHKKFIGAKLLIWTTTPWTLVANMAVSVHPNFTYLLIEHNANRYIVLEELANKVADICDLKPFVILEKLMGKSLEFLNYHHPLFDDIRFVILGEHVTNTSGTGLVHTAPGHGTDDYIVGKKYDLAIFSPIDEYGIFTNEAKKYQGLFYEKANQVILDDLQNNALLMHNSKFLHSFPHDWRTKKPVFFRATPQWFCSIEKIKNELIKNVDLVSWVPNWGQIRMHNMIVDRLDWCISRQRVWGVPIPVFYNEDGSPILDYHVIMHIAKKFKKYGSNIWFEKSVKQLLPKNYSNPLSPNSKFTKSNDTMDVWFDSGTSYHVVKKKNWFPADLYLEGTDQFRGWFNSSMITSTAVYQVSPYKEVVCHGFVLDGQGRKMSKSDGNVIMPMDIINEFGADVLRIWVSTTEYSNDVRISKDIINQCSEIYRKIRNTFKYLLSTLVDFDYKNDFVAYSMQNSVNRYMIKRVNIVYQTCLQAYEEYRFSDVLKSLMPFISNDLSSMYLDYAKDILYIENKRSFERIALQSVLYRITYLLLLLLNPIIPHTTSEAYMEFIGKSKEDIYLHRFPKISNSSIDISIIQRFERMLEIRQIVLKELEVARNNKIIGKSNEAYVELFLTSLDKTVINSLTINLHQFLIVSKVSLLESDTTYCKVFRADGVVCDRCWNTVTKINNSSLCDRCVQILDDRKKEAQI